MSQMYKIFVGNVSFKTSVEQIREVFEPYITIEDIVIAVDEETGRSRGYAFVMTRDHDKGRKAMRTIGKFELDGRLIYLKEAHGKKKPPKGQGRGRGGRPPHRNGPPPQRSNHRRPMSNRAPSSGPAPSGASGYSNAEQPGPQHG